MYASLSVGSGPALRRSCIIFRVCVWLATNAPSKVQEGRKKIAQISPVKILYISPFKTGTFFPQRAASPKNFFGKALSSEGPSRTRNRLKPPRRN